MWTMIGKEEFYLRVIPKALLVEGRHLMNLGTLARRLEGSGLKARLRRTGSDHEPFRCYFAHGLISCASVFLDVGGKRVDLGTPFDTQDSYGLELIAFEGKQFDTGLGVFAPSGSLSREFTRYVIAISSSFEESA